MISQENLLFWTGRPDFVLFFSRTVDFAPSQSHILLSVTVTKFYRSIDNSVLCDAHEAQLCILRNHKFGLPKIGSGLFHTPHLSK